MPTFLHSKGVHLAIDGYDHTLVADDSGDQTTADVADVTVYGSNGDKNFLAGQLNRKAMVSGVIDCSTGVLSVTRNTLEATLGSSTPRKISYCPAGVAVGAHARLFSGHCEKYDMKSPVKDALRFDASFVEFSSDGIPQEAQKDGSGVVVLSLTTASAATTQSGTGQDGGAASAAGYSAHLHQMGTIAANTIVCKLQHSSNNATWSDLVAWTNLTTGVVRAQRASSTSASVKRYVRGTVSGHVSASKPPILMTFARR